MQTRHIFEHSSTIPNCLSFTLGNALACRLFSSKETHLALCTGRTAVAIQKRGRRTYADSPHFFATGKRVLGRSCPENVPFPSERNLHEAALQASLSMRKGWPDLMPKADAALRQWRPRTLIPPLPEKMISPSPPKSLPDRPQTERTTGTSPASCFHSLWTGLTCPALSSCPDRQGSLSTAPSVIPEAQSRGNA